MKIRISATQIKLAERLGITAEEYATQLANMPKIEKFAGEIFIDEPYITEVDFDGHDRPEGA